MGTIEIASMGVALGASFAIINKLIDALMAKKHNGKTNGIMTAISDRLVEVVIAQQRISDSQAHICDSLGQMDRRFESTLNGVASRICEKIDGLK